MVEHCDIEATCADIVRAVAPLKIVLFGSHAYGTPKEDSDVDLLVIADVPEEEARQLAVRIRCSIPRRFPVDILVRTPAELAYRTAHNDWFIREILEKGRVLYESANAGVGAES